MPNTTIATLTKDCERQDCRILSEGSRVGLMGSPVVYDRAGEMVSGPKRTTVYTCRTCRQSWEVTTDPGKPEVVQDLGLSPTTRL
jgi:hypothetical protein